MRQLSLIDFPGVLRDTRNPETAIVALGGEESIREATKIVPLSKSATLSLNLRPGDATSSSNIGAVPAAHISTKFLLRVCIPTSDISSSSGAQARILGRIVREISFPGIADFHYLSNRLLSAVAARLTNGTSHGEQDLWKDAPDHMPIQRKRKRLRCNVPDIRWRMPEAGELRTRGAMRFADQIRSDEKVGLLETIEGLRPWRFSRTATETAAADMWFRQAGGNAKSGIPRIGVDRRSDAKRMIELPHRIAVDVEEIPKEPSASLPVVSRSADAFYQMLDKLRELFVERPVWIRRAVLHAVPRELRRKFVKAAPHAGYSFYGVGPFFPAWVRYGYDPRREREARKYQVIEVRCKHPVVVEAVRMQHRNVRTGNEELHKWDVFEADFTLSECPTQKNMFLQLCDIRMESVQELVRDEPFPEKFSPKTGHFTKEGFEKVHAAVRKGLYLLAEQKVGVGRTKRILAEKSLQKKRRKYLPRSVLDANFHRTGPTRDGAPVAGVAGVNPSPNKERIDEAKENAPEEGTEVKGKGDDLVEKGNTQQAGQATGDMREHEDAEGVEGGDGEIVDDGEDQVHPTVQEGHLDDIEGFEIYDQDESDSDDSDNDKDDGDEEDDDGTDV